MQLILSGHSYRYECENLCRLFSYSPVMVGEVEPEIRAEEPCAFAGIERKGGQYHYTAKVSDGKIPWKAPVSGRLWRNTP